MSNTIATVEVKTQMKGSAAGTLGWFKALIEDSELVIRKTRTGIPGMFLHEKHTNSGEERKANEGNTFICSPASGTQDDEGYNIAKINGIEYIYVASTLSIPVEGFSFTDYPLTPKCKDALISFIDEAVTKFAAWYEVQ